MLPYYLIIIIFIVLYSLTCYDGFDIQKKLWIVLKEKYDLNGYLC